MSSLLEKLQAIKQRFDEVADLIIQPDIISDQSKYTKYSKEYKDLGKLVEVYKDYKGKLDVVVEADEIIADGSDAEMIEMAKMERQDIIDRLPELEENIKLMLIPKDPEDDKNVIMEFRAGTGGDEACIFVDDMYRMYTMFLKEAGYSCSLVNATEGTIRGYREIVMEVKGDGVYGMLKFESGVHRVQRVPETESQGRVHTSAITVAIMPEAEEVDIDVRKEDIRRDTYRASGAGGQHVNKTESAIRLTHMPTGIVAECQEERSQHKNYDKALKYLKTKIYQVEFERLAQERAAHRKSLVSTGDRSAKIRTYNYPQGRVTDHRINRSVYDLQGFMNGNHQVGDMIEALKVAENAEKLKAGDSL